MRMSPVPPTLTPRRSATWRLMARAPRALRGVNVGGTGLIRMTDLRRIFERAGADEVSTYIASGNVLFSASARDLPGIRRRAQAALTRVLGQRAATAWRTARELQAIVETDPFARVKGGKEVKRYVLFFSGKPRIVRPTPWFHDKEGCEVFAMLGLNAFVASYQLPTGWWGFPNNMVEAELGVVSTARTWSTVAKLAALVE